MTHVALLRKLRIVAAATALALGMPAAADLLSGNWQRHQSAHFDVYSDQPLDEVAERIADLEVLHALYSRLTDANPNPTRQHPTRIFLLGRNSPLPKLFKAPRAAGLLQPGLRADLLLVTNNNIAGNFKPGNETLFHEYVHAAARKTLDLQLPQWYSEGLAEVMSTARFTEDAVVFGEAPTRLAMVISGRGHMPLREVLQAQAIHDMRAGPRARFYANAWRLTHYLQFSPDAAQFHYGQRLDAYLADWDRGADAVAAFTEHFEATPEAFEERMQDYVAQHQPRAVDLAGLAYHLELTSTPLPPAKVTVTIADHLRPANPRGALSLYRAAAEVAPEHPRALAGMALMLAERGRRNDWNPAAAAMTRAAELAPTDPNVTLDHARFLIMRCEARTRAAVCQDDSTNRAFFNLLAQAWELAPEALETNYLLGVQLQQLDRPRGALSLLQKAQRLVPASSRVIRSIGLAAAAAGRTELARVNLQRSIRSRHSGDEDSEVTAALRSLAPAPELTAHQSLEADGR